MRVRAKCGVQGRGLGGVAHLIGGHAESQTHAPCGPPRASPWPPNRRTMHQTPHECHFRMPFLQQMLRQSLATNVAPRRGPPATGSRQSWTNKGPGHTLSEYEQRPQMLRHTSTPIWVSSGGPRLTASDHLLTAHSENCLQFWRKKRKQKPPAMAKIVRHGEATTPPQTTTLAPPPKSRQVKHF